MKRQTFLKLVPRRFTPDSEIVSIGSNQYTTQWIDIEPTAIYQDRGNIEPTDLGSFTWDEATKTVTFTTTSAPDENIFIDYPLRFCTSTVEYVEDDPVTPSGGIVKWLPRLSDHISVSDSTSDMLTGVLKTSSTSAIIDNNDYYLNKYLSKYDNFKNRSVELYALLDTTYHNLGSGFISNIRSGKKINVSIKNRNSLLEAPTTLNNSEEYYEYRESFITNLPKSWEGKPIPVCYGPLNQIPQRLKIQDWYLVPPGSGQKERYTAPPDSLLKKAAYIGNYTFCLAISDAPLSRTSQLYIAITYVSSTTLSAQAIDIYSVSSEYIGYFVEGSSYRCFKTTYGFVVNSYVYFVDYDNNRIWLTGATNLIWVGLPPAEMFRLVPSREFSSGVVTTEYFDPLSFKSIPYTGSVASSTATWTFNATDSGQYLLYFTYANSDQTQFNNERWDLMDHYFVMHSERIGHSDFVQKYIESTGENIDTTSFTQAQTDLDANVLYTVNNDEKIQNIHEVLQNITTSVNAILFFDSSTKKYKYKIINSSLAGTDWTISLNDILDPDLVPNVNNKDIASTIRMEHPYSENKGSIWINAINTSRTSSFSRAFNSTEKTLTIEHHLEDSTDAILNKSETYNTPLVTYSFTLMSDNFFQINIGDIIEITDVGGRLLGEDSSLRLVVTDRTRSVEKIGIKAYDFSKIP